MSIKAARQDERANSPGPSQIRFPLEERVRQGVGVRGRTLEQKVGYWLGHILEERGSQRKPELPCGNLLVGFIVQHLK